MDPNPNPVDAVGVDPKGLADGVFELEPNAEVWPKAEVDPKALPCVGGGADGVVELPNPKADVVGAVAGVSCEVALPNAEPDVAGLPNPENPLAGVEDWPNALPAEGVEV